MRKVLTSLFNQSRRAYLLNIQSQQWKLTPLFAKKHQSDSVNLIKFHRINK